MKIQKKNFELNGAAIYDSNATGGSTSEQQTLLSSGRFSICYFRSLTSSFSVIF